MAHLVWKSCSGEMRGTGRRAQRLGPRRLRGVRRWSRYPQVVSRPPGDTTMVRRFPVSLALALATLLPRPAAAQQPAYDIVIRNGRVLDGMGNPWLQADAAIKGGPIGRMGGVPG